MSGFHKDDNPSLQELINDYNRELMRYHERSSQPPAPMPMPRPEAVEPLERPPLIQPRPISMPRPEAVEPLDRTPAADIPARSGFRIAEDIVTDADSMPPASGDALESIERQQQWMRDLEQGLRDLEQGRRDLEQGERDREQGELDRRRGEEEYARGVAERDYWREQAHAAAAPVSAQPMQEPRLQMPPLPDDPPAQINPRTDIVPTGPEDTTAQSDGSIPATGVGMGYLVVSATSARQAFPVPGAFVMITRPTAQGDVLYANAVTDPDGSTPLIPLPTGTAPIKSPSFDSPYVMYNVSIAADGYYPQNRLTAQVFSGVTATLPVRMIPEDK